VTKAPSVFLGNAPWWRRHLIEEKAFVSPLPRAELVRRMGEAIDPMFSPFGSKKAQGHVSDDGGVVRRRIYYRNSFQTLAKMKFRDQGSGTRIEAQYGMALMVLSIAALLAILVVAMAVGFVVTRQPAGATFDGVTLLPFLLFPVVFLVGLTLAVLFVKSAARKDKAFLDDFIKNIANATEA
jgi:hypothetical protein